MQYYDPIAFCCQETYMKSSNVIKFRKYFSYHIISEAIDTRASGGVNIMIKKSIPHRQISLKTNLQAVAVTLSLHKTITMTRACGMIIHGHISIQQLGHHLP